MKVCVKEYETRFKKINDRFGSLELLMDRDVQHMHK